MCPRVRTSLTSGSRVVKMLRSVSELEEQGQ